MKKSIAFFLILIVIFILGCKKPRSPIPGVAPIEEETYYNNGKIKQEVINSYLYTTITATSDYYYDSSGKIRKSIDNV